METYLRCGNGRSVMYSRRAIEGYVQNENKLISGTAKVRDL